MNCTVTIIFQEKSSRAGKLNYRTVQMNKLYQEEKYVQYMRGKMRCDVKKNTYLVFETTGNILNRHINICTNIGTILCVNFLQIFYCGQIITINAAAIMKVREVIFFMRAKHFIG